MCVTQRRLQLAGHIATSKNNNWTTGQDVVDRVRAAFGRPSGVIHLDPCSNEQSVVGAEVAYSLPCQNGLKEPWDQPNTFVNPPFGRSYLHVACMSLCITRNVRVRTKAGKVKTVTEYVCTKCEAVLDRKSVEASSIADWIAKAHATFMERGTPVIGLVPAAVSTKAFQRYVFGNAHFGASAICFPEGRLNFDGLPAEGVKRTTAPMDTCLPYWGKDAAAFEEAFKSLGHVTRLDIQMEARRVPVTQAA